MMTVAPPVSHPATNTAAGALLSGFVIVGTVPTALVKTLRQTRQRVMTTT
jgi:hypothetical protein